MFTRLARWFTCISTGLDLNVEETIFSGYSFFAFGNPLTVKVDCAVESILLN